MFRLSRKTEAFIDISNLALGGFLFLSPWIFGFTSDLGWHTSWIAGTAIGIIAIFSIGDLFTSVTIPSFIETEEWLKISLSGCGWRHAPGFSVSTVTRWLCKSTLRWGWSS